MNRVKLLWKHFPKEFHEDWIKTVFSKLYTMLAFFCFFLLTLAKWPRFWLDLTKFQTNSGLYREKFLTNFMKIGNMPSRFHTSISKFGPRNLVLPSVNHGFILFRETLWQRFIRFGSKLFLGWTYLVIIMTLSSTVFKYHLFKKSHLNAFGSKFDLDVK